MNTREIEITTPHGVMGAYEIAPGGEGLCPAILFLMDGLGYRATLKAMAERQGASVRVRPGLPRGNLA